MNEQEKTLRGDLLQFLKNIYPSEAKESSIIAAYFQYHRPSAIEHALNYLADSGLSLKIERQHPYRALDKVNFYKISPKGINLVEHSISDAGVIVIDERDI